MTLRAHSLNRLILLAAALPGLALAQYKWVDETGQVVYSDRPPMSARGEVKIMRGSVATALPAATSPAATPVNASRSTDAPGSVEVADKRGAADKGDKPDATTKESAAKPADKSAAPATLAERDAAFRKRQQERADAERKAAEQAQKNAKLAQICDDRRTDLRTLDSGARISRVEANGERSFLSDDEIAKRRDQLQKALAEDCRKG